MNLETNPNDHNVSKPIDMNCLHLFATSSKTMLQLLLCSTEAFKSEVLIQVTSLVDAAFVAPTPYLHALFNKPPRDPMGDQERAPRDPCLQFRDVWMLCWSELSKVLGAATLMAIERLEKMTKQTKVRDESTICSSNCCFTMLYQDWEIAAYAILWLDRMQHQHLRRDYGAMVRSCPATISWSFHVVPEYCDKINIRIYIYTYIV